MDMIICWLFGHNDEPWEIKTHYLSDGGWWDEVLSFHCRRRGRIQEAN